MRKRYPPTQKAQIVLEILKEEVDEQDNIHFYDHTMSIGDGDCLQPIGGRNCYTDSGSMDSDANNHFH